MSRLVLLAVVLAASFASTAHAQRVYNLPSGQYLITGEVRAIGPVISPDGPVVPPVVVPPVTPPVIPPVNSFAANVTAVVNAIPVSEQRHAAAVKICGVYQMVGSKVEDDTLPFASAGSAVSWLLKPAIGATDAATWAGVNAIVEAKLNGCQSKADSLAALNTAASSVLATAPKSEAAVAALEPGVMLDDNETFQTLAKAYGFDWNVFLMTLLELFMKYFLPMIISVVEKFGVLILFA